MKIFILFFIVFMLGISCSHKRNKLSIDQEKLATQITNEEKEKIEVESTKQVAQSVSDTYPPGIRFHENRSVDPKNPPVLLDILGTQENIREFKLSDLASSIKYIKLGAPPDSDLKWTHPKLSGSDFSIFSDDKNIFVNWIFGLARFNMSGDFQELIWKNESGINLGEHGFNWSAREFYGITPINPVTNFRDNLYIRFTDSKNNQIQFIKHEIQSKQSLELPSNDIENQKKPVAGDNMFEIKGSVYSRVYDSTFGLSENSWAGMSNTYESAKTGSVFTVFSNTGDTLCLFSSAHQVKNQSNPRVVDNKSFTWYYKEKLTFLEQYTDTIFRIIPPNKMLPVYLLDFGKDKVSFTDGLNQSNLTQKLMPFSIFETENNLFIRYTRNSAGSGNRRNKSVTFYNAIFNKDENKLYHSPEQTLAEKNIQNDLDGGLSFWPEFVTPKGDMLMLISGQKLKEYVNSEDFRNKKISEEQRQRQILMANELNESDKFVIVVN